MNHCATYESIINYRISNRPDGYVEWHHIVPKSLGGNDDGSNMVALTAREHYVCHKLLARIHGGKMWQALSLMSNPSVTSARGVRVTSRDYETAKIFCAIEKSKQSSGGGNPAADDVIYRFSHKDYGVKSMARHELCKEFGLNAKGISKIVVGSHKSYRGWCFHGKDSSSSVTEHVKPRSIMLGSKFGDEHKAALREAKSMEPVVTCPFCGASGKGGVMKRWHFDRCAKR